MSAISDKVRDARDLTEVTYTVKEWDVTLLLISPTVKERLDMVEQYTTWTEDVDGNRVANLDQAAMGPSLVMACAHDPETHERAFDQETDLVMLQTKNGAIVDNIARACFPLVGFSVGESATDPGKDDSSTTPNDDTESASPVLSAAR